MAGRLFLTYAKRNTINQYIQSHGPIGSNLINACIEARMEGYEEIVFWLFT